MSFALAVSLSELDWGDILGLWVEIDGLEVFGGECWA